MNFGWVPVLKPCVSVQREEVACRKCLGHGVCGEQDRGNNTQVLILCRPVAPNELVSQSSQGLSRTDEFTKNSMQGVKSGP